jgi:hypothetical protein
VQKLLSFILEYKNKKINMSRTVIFPVVLYGCGTLSLAFREVHKLREFENRVLRKILPSERQEVRRKWRRLRMAELHVLYFSPNVFRAIKSIRTR